MNPIGLLLLFANFLVAPLIMAAVKGVRGVILAVAAGWIVLSPGVGINIPGIPQLSKDYAVPYAAAIGVLLTRGHLLRRLRLSWIDLFFAAAMISPFISSLSNGLGAWDATSEMYGRLATWGIAYLIGRILVADLQDVRECALAILLAGMLIVPLCLIEVRLSPQLHKWVYGDHFRKFHMAVRLGGYRPTLMFRHGLEVGLWLAYTSVIAVWFALTSPRTRLLRIPVQVHTGIILFTSVVSRSLGALALMVVAIAAAVTARSTKVRLLILALTLAVPGYLGLRITGLWSPDFVVEIVETFGEPRRAASFAARVFQEEELGGKARQRLAFGWGGHNRFRVFDDFGNQTTVVDSLWLIIFGKYGLFGLVALYGMICIPSILIVLRTPTRYLFHPNMAGVVALILALFIANADSLQNAFYSPLMMIAAGALATTAVSIRRWLPQPAPPPPTTRRPSRRAPQQPHDTGAPDNNTAQTNPSEE